MVLTRQYLEADDTAGSPADSRASPGPGGKRKRGRPSNAPSLAASVDGDADGRDGKRRKVGSDVLKQAYKTVRSLSPD